MTRRIRILVILAVAALLAASCGGDGNRTGGQGPLAEGDRAPGFTLPSAQGPNVSSQDYMGQRAILLYFSMGPG
jgi:hypothetical protein